MFKVVRAPEQFGNHCLSVSGLDEGAYIIPTNGIGNLLNVRSSSMLITFYKNNQESIQYKKCNFKIMFCMILNVYDNNCSWINNGRIVFSRNQCQLIGSFSDYFYFIGLPRENNYFFLLNLPIMSLLQ